MMATITEDQQQQHLMKQHLMKQQKQQRRHCGDEKDLGNDSNNKFGVSEKSFSFDNEENSVEPTTTTTTKSKVTSAIATTASALPPSPTTTATTTTIQYDVEHLATFSTASSHEQAETTTTTTTATNDDHGDASSTRSKFKQTSKTSDIATEPRVALQKLFELEKSSGIWTQRMQIELQQDVMLVVDCETNSVVERFHPDRVAKPEAFNHYNDIYNNVIVFIIHQQQEEERTRNEDEGNQNCDTTPGELHIFQCVSHKAEQLVSDILAWKESTSRKLSSARQQQHQDMNKCNQESASTAVSSNHRDTKKEIATSSNTSAVESINETRQMKNSETKSTSPAGRVDTQSPKPVVTVASSSNSSEAVPLVNVNVKETVQVFNQIAALREKSGGISSNQAARPLSDASGSSQAGSASQQSAPNDQSSRVNGVLSAGGQFYKQRSIRATLAPKSCLSTGDDEAGGAGGAHNSQDQPKRSSSSSSVTSSDQAKFAASSSVSSSSRSADHHHQSSSTKTKHAKGLPLPPPASSAITSHHHHNHNMGGKSHHTQKGTAPPPPPPPLSQSQKQTAVQQHANGHQANQSSSLSNHHNQQQQQHGKSKHSMSKLFPSSSSSSSSSSRPPASNGHHNHGNNNNNTCAFSYGVQSSGSSGRSHGSPPLQQQSLEQVNTNESYVSVLNHCFDDIEKFIIRLQHAYAAMRELQAKKRQTKRSAPAGQSSTKSPQAAPLSASQMAMLSAQARGPSADEFFEILSKFKLAFNLLAKLKGCIHEPNAPELVHFLFTPLAIIIESARNITPPVDPALVGIPYLNKDALDLLSNCCTSKESDLWLSLGSNWTQTIDAQLLKASRLPSSFQPIFSDGWAPVISELELIGLAVPCQAADLGDHYHHNGGGHRAGRNANGKLTIEELPYAHGMAGGRKAYGMRNGSESMVEQPSSVRTSSGAKLGKERISPTGGGTAAPGVTVVSSRHSKVSNQYPGYTQASGDVIVEGPLAIVDAIHPADPYRVPELPAGHAHEFARHFMPAREKPGRSRHLNGGAGARRNSDYPGYAHYAPPTLLGPGSMVGAPHDDYLDSKPYAAGYPNYAANPSDDYTELQDDYHHHPHPHAHPHAHPHQHLPNGHYLAGSSSGRHGDIDREYYPPYGAVPRAPLASVISRRKGSKGAHKQSQYHAPYVSENDDLVEEAEREAMLLDLGPAQTEWFYELKSRGAPIVRVLFTRDANNDKELPVKRGEILEILDDTRKWWKARNIDLQVAYVPHTIVAAMEHYQTLDELLTNSPGGDMMMMMMINNEDEPTTKAALVHSQRYVGRELQAHEVVGGGGVLREDERNSKTAKGAFRYF